jgi:hypothetical protein
VHDELEELPVGRDAPEDALIRDPFSLYESFVQVEEPAPEIQQAASGPISGGSRAAPTRRTYVRSVACLPA